MVTPLTALCLFSVPYLRKRIAQSLLDTQPPSCIYDNNINTTLETPVAALKSISRLNLYICFVW